MVFVMLAGTIISYIDDKHYACAEVALRNADHVLLTLARDGLAIMRLASPERSPKLLFRADPSLATRMCDGLFSLETSPKPTPLRILVAAVVQLCSADEVGNAFRQVAAKVG
jgi:hypothetical protein